MKTLINFFISFAVLAMVSTAAVAGTPHNYGESTRIRLVEVDAANHQNEYESALANDPWNGFNYAMFKFNDAIDQFLLSPIARAYAFVMPQWGRDRVSNFFNNLGEPSNFLNSLLQGDIEGAFRAFWRFMINTTFGVGGIGDVAGGFGLSEKEKSFSQTLAVYGIGSGPYLVVPFMGPSTPRDFVSAGTAMATNPASYADQPASFILGAADVIQMREGLLAQTDDMRANSFDLYSSYKSAYLQNRKKKVLDTME